MMLKFTQGVVHESHDPHCNQLNSLTIHWQSNAKNTLMDHFMKNMYKPPCITSGPTVLPERQKFPTCLNPRYLSKDPKLSRISHNAVKHSETGSEHQHNITKLSGQHHCRTTSPIWVDGCLNWCHRERNPILPSESYIPETFRTQTPQKCLPPYGLMGV